MGESEDDMYSAALGKERSLHTPLAPVTHAAGTHPVDLAAFPAYLPCLCACVVNACMDAGGTISGDKVYLLLCEVQSLDWSEEEEGSDYDWGFRAGQGFEIGSRLIVRGFC